MKKYLLIFTVLLVIPQAAYATTIFLTTGSTWTVPSDWNSSNNTIEVIGGGGNGASGSAGGGGGGAYSKISNQSLAAGASVSYAVGGSGGDTYFCNSTSGCTSIGDSAVVAGAKGGSGGVSAVVGNGWVGPGGAGGAAASGIGTAKYSGGSGGAAYFFQVGIPSVFMYMNGGGGGAAGSSGNGVAGSAGSGTGSGAGGAGDNGSGGAGGTSVTTASASHPGSPGTEFDASHGSGGGGSGSIMRSSNPYLGPVGGAGGAYGAGGGGGGSAGGIGAQGVIVITYTPAPPTLQCNGTPETFSTPGTYTRTVPAHSLMTVEVWGGGGGGAGANNTGGGQGNAGTGGTSSFSSYLSASGGAGGTAYPGSSGGSGGTGSGGDTNQTGLSGRSASGAISSAGAGGAGANGGAGGSGGSSCYSNAYGRAGTASGGGGGGSACLSGGGGGGGGYSSEEFSAGELASGSAVTITVGAGGAAGNPSLGLSRNGSNVAAAILAPRAQTQKVGASGAAGRVTITCQNAPSCSLSLTPTTIAYGGSGSTLSYSSSNATRFYITTLGDVVPNTTGSPTVYSAGSYVGTAWGADGGTVNCLPNGGTLTVTPPPEPTATITASSTSIYTGDSTGIHATFTAGSGDTLTHDNIDSPEGTSLGATTNPDANKYITFTPSSPGNYTFYARAQTSYFTSWTTYAQTIVHVNNPPNCTPAYTCSGQTIQYTNGGCHVSDVTTCISPSFCSQGSSVCHNPSITFSPFTNDDGNYLNGHLAANPKLLPKGTPTTLYWKVDNVASCTVSGNGQTWDLVISGTGGKTTAPINQRTVFTLLCQGLSGTEPPSVSETAVVNILPVFLEK